MFKKAIIGAFVTVMLSSYGCFAAIYGPYYVNSLKAHGSNWQAGTQGAITFSCSQMPAGVTAFLIAPTDVGLENMLAILNSALINNKVIYIDCTVTTGSERQIRAIQLAR